jgi:hypothetical protein
VTVSAARPLRAFLVPVPLLLPLVLGGCLDAIGPDIGPPRVERCVNDDSEPGVAVTFKDDIDPLIQDQCAGCHSPGGLGFEVAHLDLSTYQTLRAGGTISGSQIVVPGSPCDSIIVQKTEAAPPFGARMPLSGPPYLTPDQERLLRDWIAKGARDD